VSGNQRNLQGSFEEIRKYKTCNLLRHPVNFDAGEGWVGVRTTNNTEIRNIPWQFMCVSSSTSITITSYEWVPHRTSWWHMSKWSDSLTKKQAAYLKTSYHLKRINNVRWMKTHYKLCINKAEEVSSHSLHLRHTFWKT
jgi:hypothetical protein